jgi:hypothetical protein
MEFHRFLIALSVRPGSCLAISAHLVPTCCTSSMMSCSSSSVQSSLFTDGHKWLCHLHMRRGLRVMHSVRPYAMHHAIYIMQCTATRQAINVLCDALCDAPFSALLANATGKLRGDRRPTRPDRVHKLPRGGREEAAQN